MKTIAAGEFKAHCLSIIDKIKMNHEPVVITKYGKPMVKIVPIDTDKDREDKPLKGKAVYIGDIISPIDEEWEADS